jgi:hypothetical protein
MDYKNKYLKYKQKYLHLKTEFAFVQDSSFIGGQACKNLNDELKQILESPDSTCKKIENVKKINYSEVCDIKIPLSKTTTNSTIEPASKHSLQISKTSSTTNSTIEPASKNSLQISKTSSTTKTSVSQSTQHNSPKSSKVETVTSNPVKVAQDVEIELYNYQKGGLSKNIWPLISKAWKDNNNLGIRDKETKTKLNFSIELSKNKLDIDAPIFGRGGFTAVYKLKNLINPADNTQYILRIFERNYQDLTHIMYNPKIIKEREIYKEYSYEIYYFGEIKISSKEFIFIKDLAGNDTDEHIFNNTNKDYKFDYIITRIYNTPKYDVFNNITNMTNPKKFLFLQNNIKMLQKMFLNNEFHSDYKIDNVGWNNNDTMDVIMIDYDGKTIQKANEDNTNIHTIGNKADDFYFSWTYLPEYLTPNYGSPNKIKADYTPEQFNMYSVGGLSEIIQYLKIQFKQPEIDLPVELQTNNITKIKNSLATSLHLDNKDYYLIPSYEKVLKILDYLKQFVSD